MTYFLCFFFFSFFGWILEEIYYFLKNKKFINRKTMKFLPLCPVYGFAVTIVLLNKPLLFNSKILYFSFGFIICSAAEYLFNSFFKEKFNLKIWDYSKNILNLQGNICITYSLIWGFLSLIILNFSEKILFFFSAFPNILTYFLIFLFINDLLESYNLFKNNTIKQINIYCQAIKEY
ncbi:MAG: putative ABC transporter permease [Clostridia bacterium]|nr:putative ABC transporter permease [Clostridia bacterium]